jgi:hypothetical protein
MYVMYVSFVFMMCTVCTIVLHYRGGLHTHQFGSLSASPKNASTCFNLKLPSTYLSS